MIKIVTAFNAFTYILLYGIFSKNCAYSAFLVFLLYVCMYEWSYCLFLHSLRSLLFFLLRLPYAYWVHCGATYGRGLVLVLYLLYRSIIWEVPLSLMIWDVGMASIFNINARLALFKWWNDPRGALKLISPLELLTKLKVFCWVSWGFDRKVCIFYLKIFMIGVCWQMLRKFYWKNSFWKK